MVKDQQFMAPLGITKGEASNPLITLTASLSGSTITITDTDIIGRNSRSRTYQIEAQDDETFTVPSDLSRATTNMLIGIGQRMMYLKRYGFEREP